MSRARIVRRVRSAGHACFPTARSRRNQSFFTIARQAGRIARAEVLRVVWVRPASDVRRAGHTGSCLRIRSRLLRWPPCNAHRPRPRRDRRLSTLPACYCTAGPAAMTAAICLSSLFSDGAKPRLDRGSCATFGRLQVLRVVSFAAGCTQVAPHPARRSAIVAVLRVLSVPLRLARPIKSVFGSGQAVKRQGTVSSQAPV